MNILVRIKWLLIMLFFLPINVLADVDVKFDCVDKVMLGNKVSCDISLLNSDKIVKGIKMNYGHDKVFSYEKTEVASDWKVATVNNKGLAIYNIDEIKANSKIGKVSYLISNDVTFGKEYEFVLSDIMLSDGENDISVVDKSFKVKVLSIKEVLELLSVNDEELILKDGVTEYEISVSNDVNEVTIGASLVDDSYHFIDGYGPSVIKNLNVGDNHIKIKIGTNERELITFSINVNRLKENETVSNNNITDNPKTGVRSLFVVIILLGLSIGFILFYKNEKKKGV